MMHINAKATPINDNDNNFHSLGGGHTHTHKHTYRRPHRNNFKKPGAPGLKIQYCSAFCIAHKHANILIIVMKVTLFLYMDKLLYV